MEDLKKCYYCQLIEKTSPSYPVRVAEFDLNSSAPRCPIHWRYICESCKKPYHFMSIGYCSNKKAFFCENCALDKRHIKKSFYGWKYYFEYKSLWSKKFVPSLDWLEYSNRHPFILDKNILDKNIYKYLSKEICCKFTKNKNSQNIAKKDVNEADVSFLWGNNAKQWDQAIGEEGDIYRKYITDPCLLEALGNVKGLDVIDIGCGNGYLCRKLESKRAHITGIEINEKMLSIARKYSKSNKIKYVLASATDLSLLGQAQYDRIIFNHVLASVKNCQKAILEASRILRSDGFIYIMTSHPCFSVGTRCWHFDVVDTPRKEEASKYCIDQYFSKKTYMINSWQDFSLIPYFHKTLEEYWTIFKNSGLIVENFIEPKLLKFNDNLESIVNLSNMQRVPMSCFFILRKP